MAKLMVVTVGTSLFQSASWNKDDENFKEVLGSYWESYAKHWAADEDDKGLRFPEYRRKNDFGLEALFKTELTHNNAETWAQWLAPYAGAPKTHKMRYSGELTTILSFAENEAKAARQSWQDFLREYEIYFVHDADMNAETARAAQHHAVYLQKWLQREAESGNVKCWKISGFSGKSPQELSEGLRSYQDFLQNARFDVKKFECIDVVISGGYKVYGLVGYGFLPDARFRVVYQHEELLEAIVQSKDKFQVGKTPPIDLSAFSTINE